MSTAFGTTETIWVAATPVGQFKTGSCGQLIPNVSAKVSNVFEYTHRLNDKLIR